MATLKKKKGPSPPPPFVVVMHYKTGTKKYEYLSESDAVSFACRYTRDMGINAEVIDFEGHVVVTFGKRKYDWWDRATAVSLYKGEVHLAQHAARQKGKASPLPKQPTQKSSVKTLTKTAPKTLRKKK